jgi:8-oxo-dGTP pyrophosphatase MutT (NUDIX family)
VLGPPPFWASDPADAATSISLDRVVGAVARLTAARGTVDPLDAVLERDPALAAVIDPSAIRRSAVLVACFEGDGGARVLLTRRTPNLRTHSGEVAFPGGRVDPGEDEVAAALREATEEVDLDAAAVSVVGSLSSLVTVGSRNLIHPVVGTLDALPSLRPSPAEVDRVFDVALTDLLAPGVFHEERWSRGDRPVLPGGDGRFPIYFYDVAGETIWGATARMLTELLHVVFDRPFPPALVARRPPG